MIAQLKTAWKIIQVVYFIYTNWERAVKIARSQKEIEDALNNPQRDQAARAISDML